MTEPPECWHAALPLLASGEFRRFSLPERENGQESALFVPEQRPVQTQAKSGRRSLLKHEFHPHLCKPRPWRIQLQTPNPEHRYLSRTPIILSGSFISSVNHPVEDGTDGSVGSVGANEKTRSFSSKSSAAPELVRGEQSSHAPNQAVIPTFAEASQRAFRIERISSMGHSAIIASCSPCERP